MVFGLISLQPIYVKDWVAAKEAFELALSGLPAGLARCCWTEALEQMEKLTGRPVFTAVMEALSTSASESQTSRTKLRIARDRDGRIRYIVVDRGAQSVWLTMRDMDRLRSILSQLNGYAMPNETENPELLQAIGRNGVGDSTGLVIDFEDPVCSVAVQIGQDPDELWDWPMEKFNRATSGNNPRRRIAGDCCNITRNPT